MTFSPIGWDRCLMIWNLSLNLSLHLKLSSNWNALASIYAYLSFIFYAVWIYVSCHVICLFLFFTLLQEHAVPYNYIATGAKVPNQWHAVPRCRLFTGKHTFVFDHITTWWLYVCISLIWNIPVGLSLNPLTHWSQGDLIFFKFQ